MPESTLVTTYWTCTVFLYSLLPMMNLLQTDGVFGRTTTHIFYTKDKIGTGASCDVFKGVEKASGATRALKVFKDAHWSQSEENVREVEALTKLIHRNIIGYYGREEEYGTGRGVLVMEYCSGGSLHAFLQEPENIHGLEDKEFLTFLGDICQGWKYLRNCGYLHRDIKPGNILRDVKLDGSVTYKLADFGASKKVEHDHGEFMSLAGTEEYLHPAIYERAFIDPSGRTVFTESVDLWSFGVTIYHACTGEIPFKPYGGVRKNRRVMFTMITCKPPGTIAGDQVNANDDIQWRRTLPSTCPLSPYVKRKTVDIIAGLLEADPQRQWTFQTLEDSVQKLVSLTTVSVVNTEDSTVETMYISQKASLSELREAIADVTEVSAPRQMMFYQDMLLTDEEHGQSVLSVVGGDVEEAVILVCKDETDICHSQPSSERPPTFTQHGSVDEDVKTAARMCSFIYLLLVQILTSFKVQRGLRQAQRSLCSHLKDNLHRVEKKFKVLSETCREIQSRFETMKEMESRRKEISHQSNSHVTSSTNRAKRVLSKLHQQLWLAREEICCVRNQIHKMSAVPRISDGEHANCQRKVKGSFDEAKKILQRIRKRKHEVPLSECEESMHRKDRNDLTELCQKCISQCRNHFLHNTHLVQVAFREAKSSYIRQYGKLLHVESVLEEVTRGRAELSEALTETWAFTGRAWKEVVYNISSIFEQSSKTNLSLSNQLKKDMDRNKECLKTLLEDLPDLEIVDFNL